MKHIHLGKEKSRGYIGVESTTMYFDGIEKQPAVFMTMASAGPGTFNATLFLNQNEVLQLINALQQTLYTRTPSTYGLEAA